MKAYKLILELIKHPFSEVKIFDQYNITGVRYNKYHHYYTLDSIYDMHVDICEGCGFKKGNVCKLHDNKPIEDIKYFLSGTNIDCDCPYKVEIEE